MKVQNWTGRIKTVYECPACHGYDTIKQKDIILRCSACGYSEKQFGADGIDEDFTFEKAAPKPQTSPQGIKYSCGHTSNAIIMNDTPLSMSAYLSWSSNEGRERTECFDCYLKRTNKAEPKKTGQEKD